MKIELIILCSLSLAALCVSWKLLQDRIVSRTSPTHEVEEAVRRAASKALSRGKEADVANLIERFKRNGDMDHPYCKALQSAMTTYNVSKTISVLSDGPTS